MIQFKEVTKKYGKNAALDRVSLHIPESGIYCLLGRNGAGKTTFMKALAGHIPYNKGEIIVCGQRVSPSHMPPGVGYIESGCVQFNTRVGNLIEHAAQLQDDFDRDFALEMAKRFELNLKKKFKHLSFGMKTMLTAIILLANKSEVILMDEPTLGFDAIMRNQFNTLLLESFQANPRVLMVSTHLIDEIAKVTERLIIINEGKILVEAGIEDIDERAYTLSGAIALVEPLLAKLNCIGTEKAGSVMAAHIYDDRIDPPDGVTVSRLGLQDFFVNIVQDNKGGRKNV